MFCASFSHATSPRNIHATTREVTSTAWLKIPRGKSPVELGVYEDPLPSPFVQDLMQARLFPSTFESLDGSCNQTPPLFRLIMYPGVDERDMHGYGYGQKGETLELKAVCGKHVSYFIQGEQGWRSGESTRLPPMWPGFDSRTRRHMWVEFVVGSLLCSERFFSGYSGFPLSAKTNISKFQFDPECSSV